MRRNSLARLTTGLLSLHLFAWCAAEVNARRPSSVVTSGDVVAAHSAPLMEAAPGRAELGGKGVGTLPEHGQARPGVYLGGSNEGLQQDGSFDSLEQALREPEKVRRLVLGNENPEMKHLPSAMGTLVNLEALEISCMENLEDLPEEIGKLRKLEELVIDNGNGCAMNVSLPRSIGQLENLRVLRLYGALDGREVGSETPARGVRRKALPDTLAKLQRLEELDLGRNGISSVPPQVASLRRLKKLGLDYNDIHEIPSFVGDLTGLRELSLRSNGGVRLPQSLAGVKGLRVFMGNNKLTLAEQKRLRGRFPNAVISFENEYDDEWANAEPARPKSRRGRRR